MMLLKFNSVVQKPKTNGYQNIMQEIKTQVKPKSISKPNDHHFWFFCIIDFCSNGLLFSRMNIPQLIQSLYLINCIFCLLNILILLNVDSYTNIIAESLRKSREMLNKKSSSSTLKLNSYKLDTQALQNNIRQLTQMKQQLQTTISIHKSQQQQLTLQNERLKQQIIMLQKKTVQKSNHTECQIKILKVEGELKEKKKEVERLKEQISMEKGNRDLLAKHYEAKLEKTMRQSQIMLDKYQQRITILDVQLKQTKIALELTNQKQQTLKQEKKNLQNQLLVTLQQHKQMSSNLSRLQQQLQSKNAFINAYTGSHHNVNTSSHSNAQIDYSKYQSNNNIEGRGYGEGTNQYNDYHTSNSLNRNNNSMDSNMSYSSNSNNNTHGFNQKSSVIGKQERYSNGNSQRESVKNSNSSQNSKISHASFNNQSKNKNIDNSFNSNSQNNQNYYNNNIHYNNDSNSKYNNNKNYQSQQQIYSKKQNSLHLRTQSQNQSLLNNGFKKKDKSDPEEYSSHSNHHDSQYNQPYTQSNSPIPYQTQQEVHQSGRISGNSSKLNEGSVIVRNPSLLQSSGNKYVSSHQIRANIAQTNYRSTYTDTYLPSQQNEENFLALVRKLYHDVKDLGLSATQVQLLPQFKKMTSNQNPSKKDILQFLKNPPIEETNQNRVQKSLNYIQNAVKNKYGSMSGKFITQLIVSRVQEYENSSKLNTQDLQISDLTPSKSKSSSSNNFKYDSNSSKFQTPSYQNQKIVSHASIQDNIINQEQHSFY